MGRSIKQLRQPARANEAGFNRAVAEIAASTRHLLDSLEQPQRNLRILKNDATVIQ